MGTLTAIEGFKPLNAGYNRVFQLGRLSIGLVVPIERYANGPVPTMQSHLARVKLAEKLGFGAVWLRDVPFNVPSFGDAGQPFDPFVYLGHLTAQTSEIALGVASIVLPLRHPAHVAKSAASIDVLSGGRLILGVASGDRAQEYPATNLNYHDRGKRFAESFEYIRQMAKSYPSFNNHYGSFNGDIDMLPKPQNGRLPLLITGGSQQSPQWIAQNGDGWMVYPHEPRAQQRIVEDWHERLENAGRGLKPVMQPLYFDLAEASNDLPRPLHLGFRSNTEYLIEYLKALENAGVNHVALNLRFNQQDTEAALNRIAEHVLPHFNGN